MVTADAMSCHVGWGGGVRGDTSAGVSWAQGCVSLTVCWHGIRLGEGV